MCNRLGVPVVIALSLLASACAGHLGAALNRASTTTVSISTGILTGNAQACAGLAYVPMANLQVYRGDSLVTAQRVPNGSTYRFVLPPGEYYVTNTGTPQRPLGRSVSVSSGGTAHVDIPNDCE